jgi:hypothetical protein
MGMGVSVGGTSQHVAETDGTGTYTANGWHTTSPQINFSNPNGRIQLTASTADNKFGSIVRVFTGTKLYSGNAFYGNVWWQPAKIVKVQFGFHDGYGAQNYVTGWGYNQDASDYVALSAYSQLRSGAFWVGFAGGRDDASGVSVTLTPIQNLTVWVGVPMWKAGTFNDWYIGDTGYKAYYGAGANSSSYFNPSDALSNFGYGHNAANVLRATEGQVQYDIKGIGTAAVSFAGFENTYGYSYWDKGTFHGQSAVYASFNVTAIKNLGLDIGLKYLLPITDDASNPWFAKPDTDVTYAGPFSIGLGVSYNINDMFGLKFRAYGAFAQTIKYTTQGATSSGDAAGSTNTYNRGAFIQAEVMPQIHLGSGSVLINVPVGVGYHGGSEWTDNDNWVDKTGTKAKAAGVFGAWVNPYLVVTSGPAQFYFGFQWQLNGASQLWSIGKDSYANVTGTAKSRSNDNWNQWSIPIGMEYVF